VNYAMILSKLSFICNYGFEKTLGTKFCCSRHPSTKWAQRSDKVYLTIELPDSKDVKLNLKPEGHFNFSGKGVDDLPYELDLELFDAVNVEVGVHV
jgi:hypothetical protein